MPAYQSNARLLDPETSRAAGLKHEHSGHAEAHRIKCEMSVYHNPGATGKTVAKLTGLERHEASRRLPELRADGHVRNCGNCAMGWDVCEPAICKGFGFGPETVDSQMRWFSKSYVPSGSQMNLFEASNRYLGD